VFYEKLVLILHFVLITPSSSGLQNCTSIVHGEVIGDYIVAGTFAIIGALTAKEFIDIHNARIEDLSAFLFTLEKMGVKFEKKDHDILRVYSVQELKNQ
jgi:UDP-N-acetylglucosamine enolpyruvyl transferase